LRKWVIECVDATKAQSIIISINHPRRNPATAAKQAAKIMGALNVNYKGDKWSNDEVRQLHKLCELGYSVLGRLQRQLKVM
jgi:hypothetical protein